MAGEAWEAPPLSMWDPLLGTPALFRSVQSRYSPRAEVYRYRFVGMKNGRPIYGCKQTSLGDEACFVYFDHDKWVHTSGSLNGSEIVYQVCSSHHKTTGYITPASSPAQSCWWRGRWGGHMRAASSNASLEQIQTSRRATLRMTLARFRP